MGNLTFNVLVINNDPNWRGVIIDSLAALTNPTLRLNFVDSVTDALKTNEKPATIILDVASGAYLHNLLDRHILCRYFPDTPIILIIDKKNDGDIAALKCNATQDVLLREKLTAPALQNALRRAITRYVSAGKTAYQVCEAHFSSIMQNFPEGVTVVDTDGRILFANRAFHTMIRKSPESLIGQLMGVPIQKNTPMELDIINAAGQSFPVEISIIDTTWNGEDAMIIIVRDISQEKSAVEAFHTDHEILSTIIENSPFGIAHLNRDGTLVHATDLFGNLVGYPDQTSAGVNLLENEKTLRLHSSIRDALEGGTSTLETRWDNAKTDEEIYLKFFFIPLHDSDQEINGILILVDDITEQKLTEKNLIRLSALVMSSRDAIIGLNLECNITSWNRGAEILLGYRADEMIGDKLEKVLPEDLQATLRRLFTAIKSGDEIEPHELTMIRADGVQVDVSLSFSAIMDDDKIIGVSAIASDITRRKQAERERRESAHRYWTLFENAPFGIILFDVKGRVLMVNSRFSQITGDNFDPSGKDFGVIGKKDIRHHRVFRAFLECIRDGKPKVVEDYYPINGIRAHLRVQLAPIRNGDGKIVAVQATVEDTTERKAFLDGLQKAYHETEQLLSSISSILIFVDENDTIAQWNVTAEETFDIKAKQVIGKPFLRCGIQWDWIKILPHIPDCLTHDRHIRLDVVNYVRSDGTQGMLGLTLNPVRRDSDKRFEFLIVGRDITDNIAAMERISTLSKAIEQNTSVVMVTDTDGLIEYVNPKFTQVTGYTFEEVRGKTPDFLHAQPDGKHVSDNLWSDTQTGKEWHGEMLIRGKTGSLFWWNANFYPIRNDDGVITNYVGVNEDITERKKISDQLNQLSQAVEQSPSMVAITGLNCKVQYVNKKYLETTGYDLEDVIGHRITLYCDEGGEDTVCHSIDTFAKEGREWRGEVVKKKKNGEYFWVSAATSFIRDESGNITNHLLIMTDITERKKIERELERERRNLEKTVIHRTRRMSEALQSVEIANIRLKEANRHKDHFLSSMSHELRTPLNGILGFADLLKGQFFGGLNEKQLKYVHQIEKSGKHLLELINDLLDLAKIDAGAMEIQPEALGPDDFINTVVAMMQSQFRKKNVRLETITDSTLRVRADRRRVKQVMLNLLSNALKFTPSGGCVTITMDKRDESVAEIRVKDTGIGIAPDQQEKIFSEFHQVNRARDEALGGTGIGLALTKRIIALLSGEIGVESEVNVGSTFFFTLPLVQPTDDDWSLNDFQDENSRVMDGWALKEASKNLPAKHRILVVEDNEVNLAMVLDILSIRDYDVAVARNGREAVDLAQSFNPELVLMDLRMPVLDGFEATREIRAIRGLETLPILALSASADKSTIERCHQLGMNEHIAKPIRSKVLYDALDRYLDKKPNS